MGPRSRPVAKALGGADISMLIGLPAAALGYLGPCRLVDGVQDARCAHEVDAPAGSRLADSPRMQRTSDVSASCDNVTGASIEPDRRLDLAHPQRL